MATVKEACKYGSKCYRKNPDHLKNFTHNDSVSEKNDLYLDDEGSSEPNILETTQDKRDDLAEDVFVNEEETLKENVLDKIEKFDLTQIKGIK